MCGGGGSGASGTTKYEWNDELAPRWRDVLGSAANHVEDPYQEYPYEQVADLDPYHQQAMTKISGLVNSGGTPTGQAASDVMYRTLGGDYLTGSDKNPYSGMDSPYFNQMLKQGGDEIINAYQQGTAADTTRMFNLSGAFGGSAHQNAMANNQQALGKTLSNYASGMMNNQYDRSGQDWEAERARQLGVIPGAQQDQSQALSLYNSMMGLGDVNRSVTQDRMNEYYQNWQNRMNYPYKQLDWYSGLMSRAQGGVSPNMTQTGFQAQASPFSQLLGGAMLTKGLLGG